MEVAVFVNLKGAFMRMFFLKYCSYSDVSHSCYTDPFQNRST